MNRFNKEWDDDEEEGPDGDDDFDYEEFVENEFGDQRKPRQHRAIIRYTAALLLAIFLLMTLVQMMSR